MSEVTFVAFYPSDWLAGTRGLSAAETGIYITLIAMMYERGGQLDRDDSRLARVCGTTKANFTRAIAVLLDEGKVTQEGSALTNKRVTAELKRAQNLRSVKQENANARWKKSQEKQGSDNAGALRPECNPEPEPEVDTNVSTKARPRKKRATAIPKGWRPDENGIVFAKGKGMPPPEIENLIERTHSWAEANGITRKDWSAQWRTMVGGWVRDQAKRAPPAAAPKPKHPKAQEREDIFAQLREEMRVSDGSETSRSVHRSIDGTDTDERRTEPRIGGSLDHGHAGNPQRRARQEGLRSSGEELQVAYTGGRQ